MEKVTAMAVARPATAEPWKRIAPASRLMLGVASIAPAAICAVAILLGLKFELALLFVFLPIQLVLGIIAGRRISGKRGQSDAILQIFIILFAATVFVLLVSVVWSVVEAGAKAISWQFFTQNNVYISPTTSLEYGGVGHAIIGTLLEIGRAHV